MIGKLISLHLIAAISSIRVRALQWLKCNPENNDAALSFAHF